MCCPPVIYVFLVVEGSDMNGFEALLVYPVVGKTAIDLTQMSYFNF
jgi:hypothetical protein